MTDVVCVPTKGKRVAARGENMRPFYFVVATMPFALYLLALAWLHGRKRPTLVTGGRDFVALALSVVGVLFIGPLQIVPTYRSWIAWGVGAWVLVALLFIFAVAAVQMALRPRFVVYNTSADALRKTLSRTAIELDSDARWSGDAMNMPGLGVQFFLDDSPRGRATSIVAIGRDVSQTGWKRLRDALDASLEASETPKRRLWAFFAISGFVLLALDVWCCVQYSDQIADSVAFYLSA